MEQIQIIFYPGTFGHCLRWLLDRFSPNSNFKNIDSPWDENMRAHGFKKEDYNPQFISGHESDLRWGFPHTKKIVIGFNTNEIIFAERCDFYRSPGNETEEGQYSKIIKLSKQTFNSNSIKLETCFGKNVVSSKLVAKEIYKILFHEGKNLWWERIFEYINNKDHFQFPLQSLWNEIELTNELKKISNTFQLNLQLEETVIKNTVNTIKNIDVIKTRWRASDVLNAVKNNQTLNCKELDIIEQAWIEVNLEKQHDSLIFPYGTNWFENTNQINEFIETYPSYLKHMNPRLPWYNNIKNPYYLKGKID